MAEQTVELAPGESKQVSFEAIPHEAKTYQITVDGLTGSFVASYASAVSLFVQGPPSVQTFWGIYVYDPIQRTKQGGMWATGDKASVTMNVKSKEFMVIFDYLPSYPVGYPYQYGPYKVVVPDWGSYSMNIVTRVIPGAIVTDLSTLGKSRVTLQGVSSYSYYGPAPGSGQVPFPGINFPRMFMVYSTVRSSAPISGYEDIGKYLVGVTGEQFWFNASIVGDEAKLNAIIGGASFTANLTSSFWDYGNPGQARAQCWILTDLTLV